MKDGQHERSVLIPHVPAEKLTQFFGSLPQVTIGDQLIGILRLHFLLGRVVDKMRDFEKDR